MSLFAVKLVSTNGLKRNVFCKMNSRIVATDNFDDALLKIKDWRLNHPNSEYKLVRLEEFELDEECPDQYSFPVPDDMGE